MSIDLSVGTPVDEVDPLIQQGLQFGAAAPGYPATAGTPQLREAIVTAMERRFGVTGLSAIAGSSNVLPVVGTKEAIAWLPFLLGATEGIPW